MIPEKRFLQKLKTSISKKKSSYDGHKQLFSSFYSYDIKPKRNISKIKIEMKMKIDKLNPKKFDLTQPYFIWFSLQYSQ